MWIKDAYSRLLIDNHISDIDKKYMKYFKPERYVEMVKLSGVESSMVYACDHNGNSYYPTKIGHVHNNIKSDIFGEIVDGLNKEGIIPIAYYTVIYHNYFAKTYPEIDIRDNQGRNHEGRYYFACPNNPKSVELFKGQIKEILEYPIKGIFIDMSFWPSICMCDACKKKYGKEIPNTIDWNDPNWVDFQRFREKSMGEFAQDLTDYAKKLRPDITVTHQFSPVLHGWYLGQSNEIAKASDYASGDFYGDKIQQRFGVKVFDAYSKNKPFEFMTSRCVDLHDHTSTKCDEELTLSALTTLANGGAYFFIDAINPNGTLEKDFYKRLKKINEYLKPYREVIKNNDFKLTGNVGLYFSMTSCVDKKLNGTKLKDFDPASSSNMSVRKNLVLEETLGYAEILTELHFNYKVITDTVTDYREFDTIIICDSEYLPKEVCERLEMFVFNGGMLVITGATSLYDEKCNGGKNFQLSHIMGVDFTGKYSPSVNYTGKENITCNYAAPLVKNKTADIADLFTFPDFPVNDEENYASIHSNPPGKKTDYPAVTYNYWGKGICFWIGAKIGVHPNYSQKEFLKSILLNAERNLLSPIPENVEFTMLQSKDATLLCFVNMQNQYPPLPIYDLVVTIQIGRKCKKIIRVKTNEEIDAQCIDDFVNFRIRKLELGEFFLVI